MAQIRQSTIRAYDKGVQKAIKVFTHQGYVALISQCIACEKSKYSKMPFERGFIAQTESYIEDYLKHAEEVHLIAE